MNIWSIIEADIIKTVPIFSALFLGILGPIAVVRYKHFLYRKNAVIQKRKEDFNNALVIQEVINESLNKLQSKLDLDRLWVAQFHNGGNFYPGNKSMKKMSVTFESTAPGIAADIMKMQSLPISFFSSALQKLNTTHKDGLIIDIYEEDDCALKNYWETKGANAVYLFPICSIDDLFIGVLGVELVKEDNELSTESYNALLNESKVLSGYVAALSIEKS